MVTLRPKESLEMSKITKFATTILTPRLKESSEMERKLWNA